MRNTFNTPIYYLHYLGITNINQIIKNDTMQEIFLIEKLKKYCYNNYYRMAFLGGSV